MEYDYHSARDNKCTYHNCKGQPFGGIVDESMKPWHEDCARRALSEYPRLRGELLGLLMLFVASTLSAILLRVFNDPHLSFLQ